MAPRSSGRPLITAALLLLLTDCGGAVTVTDEQSPVPTTIQATSTVSQTIFTTTAPAATAAISTTSSVAPPTPSPVQPTATAVRPATATSQRATASTAVSQASGLSLNAAEQVTGDFLSSLQKNPSGKDSVQYLSATLQQQLQQGRPIATIVGVQNMYQSFSISDPMLRAGGRAATVQATLHYTAGPEQRLVTLVPENGAWRIDDIEATG